MRFNSNFVASRKHSVENINTIDFPMKSARNNKQLLSCGPKAPF